MTTAKFSGVGGVVSARFTPRLATLTILSIPVVLLVSLVLVPFLCRLQAAALGLRVAVTLTALFPMFFAMGVAFPFGLGQARRAFPDSWGIRKIYR